MLSNDKVQVVTRVAVSRAMGAAVLLLAGGHSERLAAQSPNPCDALKQMIERAFSMAIGIRTCAENSSLAGSLRTGADQCLDPVLQLRARRLAVRLDITICEPIARRLPASKLTELIGLADSNAQHAHREVEDCRKRNCSQQRDFEVEELESLITYVRVVARWTHDDPAALAQLRTQLLHLQQTLASTGAASDMLQVLGAWLAEGLTVEEVRRRAALTASFMDKDMLKVLRVHVRELRKKRGLSGDGERFARELEKPAPSFRTLMQLYDQMPQDDAADTVGHLTGALFDERNFVKSPQRRGPQWGSVLLFMSQRGSVHGNCDPETHYRQGLVEVLTAASPEGLRLERELPSSTIHEDAEKTIALMRDEARCPESGGGGVGCEALKVGPFQGVIVVDIRRQATSSSGQPQAIATIDYLHRFGAARDRAAGGSATPGIPFPLGCNADIKLAQQYAAIDLSNDLADRYTGVFSKLPKFVVVQGAPPLPTRPPAVAGPPWWHAGLVSGARQLEMSGGQEGRVYAAIDLLLLAGGVALSSIAVHERNQLEGNMGSLRRANGYLIAGLSLFGATGLLRAWSGYQSYPRKESFEEARR